MTTTFRWFQIGSTLAFAVMVSVMVGAQKVEASHPCPVIQETQHCHQAGHCVCPPGYTVHKH